MAIEFNYEIDLVDWFDKYLKENCEDKFGNPDKLYIDPITNSGGDNGQIIFNYGRETILTVQWSKFTGGSEVNLLSYNDRILPGFYNEVKNELLTLSKSAEPPKSKTAPLKRKRRKDAGRLWLAFLANEKIKSNRLKYNLENLYHGAGQTDANGLSKAITDVLKLEEKSPEEFEKLMKYGSKHPVQEIKENKEYKEY